MNYYILGEFVYGGCSIVMRSPEQPPQGQEPYYEVVITNRYGPTVGIRSANLSQVRANFELCVEETLGRMSYSEVDRNGFNVVRAMSA